MNITCLSLPLARPVGGNKIIYRLAEQVAELLGDPGRGMVMHPYSPRFECTWFEHHVRFNRTPFRRRWLGRYTPHHIGQAFHPAQDLVVVPEVWATRYGTQLAAAGIRYAIFVQNGYHVTAGDWAAEHAAYSGAEHILSISDDTSDILRAAFPDLAPRVYRLRYAVDSKRFQARGAKERLITYMPRRLPEHAHKVLFLLRQQLPEGWRVQAIDGLNEASVADLLGRSQIFLSFSAFEGCPLPPLEAALAGNWVIGYTGEGGKEYWDPAVFTEVHCGDILGHVRAVAHRIATSTEADEVARAAAVTALAVRYSQASFRADTRAWLDQLHIQ